MIKAGLGSFRGLASSRARATKCPKSRPYGQNTPFHLLGKASRESGTAFRVRDGVQRWFTGATQRPTGPGIVLTEIQKGKT